MDLVKMVADFCADNEGKGAMRATFEAAMKEKIEYEGWRMSDLFFAVYESQLKIAQLEERVASLEKPKRR